MSLFHSSVTKKPCARDALVNSLITDLSRVFHTSCCCCAETNTFHVRLTNQHVLRRLCGWCGLSGFLQKCGFLFDFSKVGFSENFV